MQRIGGRPVAAALLALATASPAAAARLEVTLAPRPGLASDAEVRVVARQVGPPATSVESTASAEAAGRVGGHATLDLAPGTWELTAQAPGVWAAPEVVHVDGDTSVALRLHQAGAVTGAVRTQGRGRPPERLRLLIQAAPGERSLGSEAAGSDCPVREGGAFRCEVPVGTLDLRLQAPGFITRYRWGAAVTAARPFEWGEALLEPGASLVGWAVVSGDTPLGERATAELYPAGLARGATLAELTQRQEAVVLRTGINDRGFFHFDGLPPGDYLLVARQAPYAPAEAWVRVLAGVEAQLNQSLVLSPPAELRVFIDPPTGPAGETWSVELFKGSPGGNLTRADRATAAADGSALLRGLTAGEYQVAVRSREGERWAYREVAVDREPAPLFIDIPLVAVRGRVLLGDDPLPEAALTFGGEHGQVTRRFRADREGRFAGALPGAGEWEVAVRAAEPRVSRTLPRVTVRGEDEELILRLSNARLRGRVVDRQGTPVAGAILTLSRRDTAEESPTEEEAGEDGTFDLHGLPEGALAVQARARRGTSPEVTVELREEAESAPLTLVVSERAKLTGQVLGPSGPVPGAQVMAAPAHEPLSAAPLLRTDATGSFSLEVATETREVVARIGAPGFAYALRRAPVVHGQPLRLTVEQAGGTLVLDLGDLADPTAWRSEVPLLVKDGVAVAPTELALWARANGESQQGQRLAVPMMEPGSYALCRVPMASAADVFAGRWPVDRCTAGSLSPFGQLRLELGPS